MARNSSSSSKRSESPVSVTGPIRQRDPLPQTDGASSEKHEVLESEPTPEIPEMPLFLRLTSKEIHEKYTALTILENARVTSLDDDKWARLDPDPVLDRYTNIHPWANNRIHLHVPEGVNDYINATHVSLVSSSEKRIKFKASVQDKYICMQGPKQETIDHTWHMLWHELSNPYTTTPGVIIMLSSLRGPDPNRPRQTIEKCYQYFPMDEHSPSLIINETGQLGDDFKATVKFVSREPTPPGTAIEIRKLLMSREGEENEGKLVWHFLYPSWPDFGALGEENVSSIISLMALSREKNGGADNPRLVHCSAGVGRTGTFIALEHLAGELEGGGWKGWDTNEHAGYDAIYDTVNQLREQRRSMVQSLEQYAFLYGALKRMWEEKYNASSIV